MMRGLWYKVPSELFNDPAITKADLAVFAYIADRLKGESKPVSVRSVACATEYTQRAVQKSLRKLVERRYLLAEERPGHSTVYTQTLLPIKKTGQSVQEDPAPAIRHRVKEVI